MKKIVSCTIATALAATNLTTVSADVVKATTETDDSINMNENINNSANVTVEDTEKIENTNNSITDDNGVAGNSYEVNDSLTYENNESLQETNREGESEKVESTSSTEQGATNNSEVDINFEETSENITPYGKLEFDINFNMPILGLDSIDININKDNQKVAQLSNITELEGTLENGATYTIEKLNSNKQPLEDGQEDVYYLHITIEKLELGTYSADINAEGYIEAKVDDIEIKDYSKRVILDSGSFLAGDVNGDGIIDMGDYNLVFENIGSSNKKYDINKDGKVNIADLTYVNSNINASKIEVQVVNTDAIIDVSKVNIITKNSVVKYENITDLLVDSENSVLLEKTDGEISEESPLTIDFDLTQATRNNSGVEMEQIVIKAPQNSTNEEAGVPETGYITYIDENGVEQTINFGGNNQGVSTYVREGQDVLGSETKENGDIVIYLGSQVAVKEISINVTGNRGNKNISEIAKIEFLNNVYKEIPKPDMNIPTIKTVETSTNLHDERITISWEAQPNVTSYEVMYQKLDASGNVKSTKKLQTNKTNLNILDKDIKPYDLYRVSIQSLNGEWSSGYEDASTVATGFDGKADNVDENYNPIDSYYANPNVSVSEIQVIPKQSPEPPRNLTTIQGYKSFTVSWEKHSQALDFDVYYRKIGDENKEWIKANSTLIRGNSYTINNLEDNTSYEVRATATNHLGTSDPSSSYIASTTSVNPPVLSEYKLINRPTYENEIGTTHIIDVRNKNDKDGWGNDGSLSYDSEYALVDGDFTTSWKVNDWDTGAIYGANRGSEITFDSTYQIGSLAFAETLEQGYPMSVKDVKVTYWDEEGNKNIVWGSSIQQKTSNGHKYYIVKLSEPINAKKIKVDTAGWGGNKQTMSELRFYEYDSLADDIKALYTDDLRLVLKDEVTQDLLDELSNRLNTPDPVSNEYHPDKDVLEKELEVAQLLFNDKAVSEKITAIDASIRTDNEGPSLGMGNDWQSLGSVARPRVDENGTDEQIVVYMGSSDPNTRVQITFLQNYGLPGSYMGGTVTIKPGRTEITIPSIISANVEKGGQVMARVTSGSTSANIQIRLSGVTDIPHLNVNNLINDSTKVEETKSVIRTYITDLKQYMSDVESMYPNSASDTDNAKNIYTYDEQTSVLNTTDIEGDRFTLTLPASEILKGIEDGLSSIDDQVDRVYNALLAWEQEVQVGFAKKGVFEEVKDFNGNGEIDAEDKAYFSKHRAPLTRLNIKYQRMMLGAAAYASSHHIGVGFGASQYIKGVPYKFSSIGTVTNKEEAHLYGALIGHEMGHAMDIGDRLYPETSNNLMAAITGTMLDENSPYVSAMKDVYEKVTSNTIGLSTNRSVVLNMLWQPYLAYEDDSTYKMLLTDNDADLSNDSFYAKLNRAYREMTAEERANGDRDQWLIRMTSKVAEKDLTDFYEAHGIIANQTTLDYVSQFDKETKKIQYINEEARRRRMAGTANMEAGTTLSASFGTDSKGNEIIAGSYVNDKKININLSVDKSNDNILGYEIYRNGEPCGFITRDESNDVTVYTDVVDNMNNRVVTYSAIAYDYNLNPTNKVELGTVKVRHEGGVDKSTTILTTNTISINEESNDIHSHEGNEDLKLALDDKDNTAYEGRMLTKNEYNSSVHATEMNPNNNPYLILDTTEMKTLVGIKYTAPTETTGLIFKREAISSNAISKYKIEVSKDGSNWTTVKEGTMNLTAENPTETIYFDKEGTEGGKQLASYNARYVKITALGTKNISAAELEVITPPGDNIEIGVSEDNINYVNGIGKLTEEFVYQVDDESTDGIDEKKSIPAGSIVITGEYRGNPAFNVPLVLNQDDEHIADKYTGILMAEVPTSGNLEEISKGTWIYFVKPEDATTFMTDNEEIFAELYRTDSADALEGGQRLVSDTFRIEVPGELPEITLSNSKLSLNGRSSSSEIKVIEIKEESIKKITETR